MKQSLSVLDSSYRNPERYCPFNWIKAMCPQNWGKELVSWRNTKYKLWKRDANILQFPVPQLNQIWLFSFGPGLKDLLFTLSLYSGSCLRVCFISSKETPGIWFEMVEIQMQDTNLVEVIKDLYYTFYFQYYSRSTRWEGEQFDPNSVLVG